MPPSESIFFDFKLPTATTWLYFSLLLAVALFFKFSRLLSMRNLDLLLLFLPVPGLLLLLEPDLANRWGFGWLLAVSLLLLLRCLFDLLLERRPALEPNLSLGGLAWLAGTLFLALIALAAREPPRPDSHPQKGPPVPERAQRQAETLLEDQTNDDVRPWVRRSLALASHLAVLVALVLIGWWHFRDVHAGMAAATFYLLLPYTYLLMPYATGLDGRWYDVWPTALLTWAIALYRRPTVAGLLLGLAAASVSYPLLLLPLWLSFYWGRGTGRFLGAFAVGGGVCVAWLLALACLSGDWPHNVGSVWPMDLRDWIPWPSAPLEAPSFWQGVHRAYRLPVFLLYLVLLIVTAFWPAPKNLAHLIALSAALLLGTQLWFADRGGIQVLWYLPLLLLLTFRPNLSSCQPPPIVPETDWLARLRRRLTALGQRMLGRPRPSVPAPG